MFEGKRKAVTFSYDDGVMQDIRLIELLERYNLKATFNLNSNLFGVAGSAIRKGKYVRVDRVKKEDIKAIYKNHEVAVHTLSHPDLTKITDSEVIYQVKKDQDQLEKVMQHEIVGMAYPGGGINFNNHISQLIQKKTNLKYARTTLNTDSFSKQKNLFQYKPNVYHIMNIQRLFELGEQFIQSTSEKEQIFYVWGHSFEFDINDTWAVFEEFLKMISNREDIYYGTNQQVLLQ